MSARKLSSFFGQVVLGPPGSGKTTYSHYAKRALSTTRRTAVVNLDPANESGWSGSDIIDIRELIRSEDAQQLFHLGPNASFILCLEFLDSERGRKWLLDRLVEQEPGTYFIFDLPGQIELVTHHQALGNVFKHLTEAHAMRLVAVHLVDCTLAMDASKLISAALLSLSTMMRLALPHYNVLSKADLLDEEELDFNLDFYTEAPNYTKLAERVKAGPRYRKLTKEVCDLLDNSSLVAFKLVSVRIEQTVWDLLQACDGAVGYVPVEQSSS
jgi:GTPase SAR1 family protein